MTKPLIVSRMRKAAALLADSSETVAVLTEAASAHLSALEENQRMALALNEIRAKCKTSSQWRAVKTYREIQTIADTALRGVL